LEIIRAVSSQPFTHEATLQCGIKPVKQMASTCNFASERRFYVAHSRSRSFTVGNKGCTTISRCRPIHGAVVVQLLPRPSLQSLRRATYIHCVRLPSDSGEYIRSMSLFSQLQVVTSKHNNNLIMLMRRHFSSLGLYDKAKSKNTTIIYYLTYLKSHPI